MKNRILFRIPLMGGGVIILLHTFLNPMLAQNCTWQDTPIGSLAVGAATYNTCDPVTADLSATAYSSSTTADEQYFVYRELCGDGELMVELTGLTPENGRYGIEFRSGTDVGAMKFGLKTPDARLGSFTTMTRTAADVSSTDVSASQANVDWLKIVRVGDVFTSYTSSDGISWTQAHTAAIVMDQCIVGGMLVHSPNIATGTNGGFDNISFVGDGGSPGFLFCGWETKTTPIDTSLAEFADRFGNLYTKDELLIPGNPTPGEKAFDGCNCNDYTDINTGFFDIWFEDCDLNTNKGFDDPDDGDNRRKALCQVFADLAGLIQANNAVCTNTPGTVNIQVIPSELGAAPQYYDSPGFPHPPWDEANILGGASAFYYYRDQGILHGQPWVVINSGVRPQYPEDPVYDASIRINFSNPGIIWHLDYNAVTVPVDQYDLYGVCFHETLHALDFSDIFAALGFTSFEKNHVENATEDYLIINNSSPSLNWEFDSEININDLYGVCNTNENSFSPLVIIPGTNSAQYPVYTGLSFENGSSWSHLEVDCTQDPTLTPQFLMTKRADIGTKYRITEEEKDILRIMGYDLGEMNGCSFGGVFDSGPYFEDVNDTSGDCNSELKYILEYCNLSYFEIFVRDLIFNDYGAEGVSFIQPHNPEDGFVTGPENIGGHLAYRFYPSRLGSINLLYVPLGCSGEEGNVTFVTVNVIPDLSEECLQACVDYVPCSDFLNSGDCIELLACDQGFNPDCNLICNPKICGSLVPVEGFTPPRATIESTPSIPDDARLPGWTSTHGTPDFVTDNVFDPTSGFIHLGATAGNLCQIDPNNGIATFSEGVRTFVPVTENTKYLLGFDTGNYPITDAPYGLNSNIVVTLVEGLQLSAGAEPPLPMHTCPQYTGIPEIPIVNHYFSTPEFEVQRVAGCFASTDAAYNALWFYVDPEFLINGETVAVLLDNVELIEDNFTAGPDQTEEYCGTEVVIGGQELCLLTNMKTTYQWHEIAADNSETLLFSYSLYNDELTVNSNPFNLAFNSNTMELTVIPLSTTTYRLTRSLGDNEIFCVSQDELQVEIIDDASTPLFSFDVTCSIAIFQSDLQGSNPQWTFGDGETSTELNPIHSYNLPGTYAVTLSLLDECNNTLTETISVTTEDCGEALSCDICGNGSTIDINNVTYLSEVLSVGSHVNETYCIQGVVRIKNNFDFTNCKFLMHPGASLIVETGNLLDIKTSQLTGCSQMWRGIEIEKGGRVQITESLIADAQYGFYAQPDNILLTELLAANNTFRNNFVSIFVPPLGKKLKHSIIRNDFINDQDLKQPFSGQSALSENLPEQNNRSLSGIIINKLAGFTCNSNDFISLTSGIIGNESDFAVFGNSFLDIRDNAGNYPSFQERGKAILSFSEGSNTLTANSNNFVQCNIGVFSRKTKLTAKSNTMLDVAYGILASLTNAGGIIIGGVGNEQNTITDAVVGISVLHSDPTGNVDIVNNKVTTNAAAMSEGAGIRLVFNFAPSIIKDNTVDINGGGSGIILAYGRNNTIDNNTIKLNNPLLNDAGILMEGTQNNLLKDNNITGSGITGADNIGIKVNSSPGNVYCCNIVENTRTGVQFWGGCTSTDDFRGTTFGSHETALVLNDTDSDGAAQTYLGTQTQTENKWTGTPTSGSDAVWVDGQFDAQFFPFLVDNVSNPEFMPDMPMPADWFKFETNVSPMDVCLPANCVIDEFVSDSPDAKKIASGQVNIGDYGSIPWELERYLYGKIAEITVTDPTIINFKSISQNNSVGQFYTIKSDEEVMFEANSAERVQLAANLSLIDGKLDSMSDIDILLLDATTAEYDGLIASKQQLSDEIYFFAETNLILNQTIITNRALTASSIKIDNNNIGVTYVYEQNEKTVNDLHLKFVADGMQDLPQTDIDILQTVAVQCPLEGGNAVYKARAFLALFTEIPNYDDASLCGNGGNKSLQKPNTNISGIIAKDKLKVYPNPAKNSLTIQWKMIDFEKGNLVFYDVFGKQILQKKLDSGVNSQIINLQHLQSGLYFIRVKLDDEPSLVQRVIINK